VQSAWRSTHGTLLVDPRKPSAGRVRCARQSRDEPGGDCPGVHGTRARDAVWTYDQPGGGPGLGARPRCATGGDARLLAIERGGGRVRLAPRGCRTTAWRAGPRRRRFDVPRGPYRLHGSPADRRVARCAGPTDSGRCRAPQPKPAAPVAIGSAARGAVPHGFRRGLCVPQRPGRRTPGAPDLAAAPSSDRSARSGRARGPRCPGSSDRRLSRRHGGRLGALDRARRSDEAAGGTCGRRLPVQPRDCRLRAAGSRRALQPAVPCGHAPSDQRR